MVTITNSKLSFFLLLFVLPFPANAGTGLNPIDRCWRGLDYTVDRSKLATCSVGFTGKMTQNRGPGLKMYKVTDPSDDPVNPTPGTLRYGATKIAGKVWISFEGDVLIKLRRPLLVSSFTAIDGRGANVHIANGDGFLLHEVKNVIIHGLNFHHNHPTAAGPVIRPGGTVEDRGKSDGDAISVMHSNNIWIDHNTLSQGQDGLIDVTHGSTNITISNNWFMDHDKVMLLGHSDSFVKDSEMKVTIAFNRFGPNCNQRMPRVRRGYAHVVNNFYDGWKEYAIGGSMNPSITSQANVFVASKSNKEVRKFNLSIQNKFKVD